jgi:ABC-type branched-subunit amino acid transport system ATPase component
VLRGIDLSVPEHAAVALIGASGSGKSTLLRSIDLLERRFGLAGAIATRCCWPAGEPVQMLALAPLRWLLEAGRL